MTESFSPCSPGRAGWWSIGLPVWAGADAPIRRERALRSPVRQADEADPHKGCSGLVGLVEVTGFELATSTMRTYILQPR